MAKFNFLQQGRELSSLLLFIGASFLASCSEDPANESMFTENRISFIITEDTTANNGTTRAAEDIVLSRMTSKAGEILDLKVSEGPSPRTRGAQVTTAGLTSFGVSASAYPSSGTYTGYGHGTYFYKQQVTAGSPMGFYWPTSDYRMSFFAYYPYGNSAFTVQSAASATGHPTYAYTVPTAIGSQVDVMTASQTDIAGGSSSPVSLSFSHQCAAIKVRITNSTTAAITVNSVSIEGVEYTGTLCNGTWTLSGTKNSSSVNPFTLTCNTAVAASATADLTGTTNIFLMLPQTLTSSAKLKMVIDSEEYEAELSGSWQAGRTYTYSVTKEPGDTSIDLSMVDNAGNARASMMTANCYLVHAAGDYKLPLVYGNAIKNGAVNTVAFNPGTVTNGTDRFVNHADAGITGPWITKSGSGADAGMGLTAASAELLWQDRTSLITAVSVDGDYLKFTVGTFGGGNALIAVKDGSGNILWSWHIWATTDNLSTTTAINTGSHTYNVAHVNLGWVPTGGGGKQGYFPYYQWGRKDPFIPAAAYNSTANHTVYNISNATVTGLTCQASTTVTIGDNIKNPTTHYFNSNNCGPVSTTYYNMWDAQNAAADNVATATKKTIYDPCPPGFCVPTGNLWYYFGNGSLRFDSNWDSTNLGKTWTLNSPNIWFPAAGNRNSSSGALSIVGSNGYYWSATPSDTYYGRFLFFVSGGWRWLDDFPATGFSVRPVAEE